MRSPLAVSALLLAAAPATAAVTKSFRQTTAKDFEEGEATASMVLPTGDVVPGMKSSPIGLDAAFVWCGALSPDGKIAYFGTGDQGRIYAVDTNATGGKARLVDDAGGGVGDRAGRSPRRHADRGDDTGRARLHASIRRTASRSCSRR